jgi:hypothetical protein
VRQEGSTPAPPLYSAVVAADTQPTVSSQLSYDISAEMSTVDPLSHSASITSLVQSLDSRLNGIVASNSRLGIHDSVSQTVTSSTPPLASGSSLGIGGHDSHSKDSATPPLASSKLTVGTAAKDFILGTSDSRGCLLYGQVYPQHTALALK